MPQVVRINEVFDPLYSIDARYINCYGGRRSGKSYAVSQLLMRRCLEHGDRKVVVMRKYATTIRLSVWARVLDAIEETVGQMRCKINKTEKEIRFPNGSMMAFIGADDPQKLKSLEGITDYWLEEANEFVENDFDTLDAGLSAPVDPPPQMWLTYNPIPVIPGFLHWIQERFLQIEHKLGEIALNGSGAVLRTFYKHNAFCPKETIQVLEGYKKTNPDLYKMWGLGEFTTLRGVILTNWDIVSEVPGGVQSLGYGLDFGFANDPATVVEAWRQRNVIWVQEKVCATELTNPELSIAMEDSGLNKAYDLIVADSAEPKSIQDLQNLGWLISGVEKKGRDYNHAAANYLRSLEAIHILEGSTNLIKEVATWSWKRDKARNILPIPQDGNDHCIDAMKYLVYEPAAGEMGEQKQKRKPITAGMRDMRF